MISRKEIAKVGRLGKTVVNRGSATRLSVTFPDVVLDDVVADIPFIIDIDGIFVPFYVKEFGYQQSTAAGARYIVEFSDVDAEDAGRLAGKDVYFLVDDFREYVGDTRLFADSDSIVGYSIVTDGKYVGKIVAVNDSTSNTLFIVDSPDGKEILIPVADEFVSDIDDSSHTITMTLPEGLITIND